MARLDAIYDNQVVMMKKLQEIQQDLHTIMNNQKNILNSIVQLHRTIEQNFKRNQRDVLINQKMISIATALAYEIAWEDMNGLGSFIDTFIGEYVEWKYQNGAFQSYHDMKSHFDDNKSNFHKGWNAVLTKLSSYTVSQTFLLETQIAMNIKLEKELDSHNEWFDPNFLSTVSLEQTQTPNNLPHEINIELKNAIWGIILRLNAISFWKDRFSNTDNIVQVKALLLASHPTDNIGSVTRRYKNISTKETKTTIHELKIFEWIYKNIENLVDPQQILKVSKWVIQTHHYIDLIDHSSDNLYDENSFLENIDTFDITRSATQTLTNALKHMNLAIAQQSITAGEGILPIISYYLAHPTKQKKYRQAFNLLKFSPLLATNWLNYALHTAIQHNEWELETYDLAMSQWKYPDNFFKKIQNVLAPDQISTNENNFNMNTLQWKLRWTYTGNCMTPNGKEKPYAKMNTVEKLGAYLPREVLYNIRDYWELVFDLDGDFQHQEDQIVFKLPTSAELYTLHGSIKHSIVMEDLLIVRNQIEMALAEYSLAVDLKSKQNLYIAEDIVSCIISEV